MKLLPCPFCGDAAEVEREGTSRLSAVVACTYCGARLESNETGAGRAWNSRHGSIETQHTIAAWADATFGPVSSLTSIAERAMTELRELVEKCRKLDDDECEEWHGASVCDLEDAATEAADVVIVLSRLFVELGVDMHAAIDRKMAINRARRWTLDGNGHGQHVEDE